MTWTLVAAIWVTLFAGLALAMARDLLRVVLGLALIGSAVNLILMAAGRVGPPGPAVIPYGEAVLGAGANPLPQALVLTAIVIGFALTCFAFVLLLGLVRTAGTADTTQLRFAEPVVDDPVKPPLPAPGTANPIREAVE
jgi:multicomponent Na+:H+ antiporter subunit C